METTGIIGEIDNLGRIILSEELRYELGMQDGEKLVLHTDGNTIRLKKYRAVGTSQTSGFLSLANFNEKLSSHGDFFLKQDLERFLKRKPEC